jgi:hypothetical protein
MAMNPEKAARVAAKRNERLWQRMPLFADQLPQQTADDVMREFAGYARRMEECRARLRVLQANPALKASGNIGLGSPTCRNPPYSGQTSRRWPLPGTFRERLRRSRGRVRM